MEVCLPVWLDVYLACVWFSKRMEEIDWKGLRKGDLVQNEWMDG